MIGRGCRNNIFSSLYLWLLIVLIFMFKISWEKGLTTDFSFYSTGLLLFNIEDLKHDWVNSRVTNGIIDLSVVTMFKHQYWIISIVYLESSLSTLCTNHYQPGLNLWGSSMLRSKDAGDSVMTPGVLQSMSILFIVCIIIFRFDDQSLRLPNHDTSAIINNSNTASHDSCALCSEEGCLQ